MTNLFIFTASDEAARRNFVHTIEGGVPFDDLVHVLPETIATQLADSTGSDLVFAWGAQEKDTGKGNRNTWQRMQAGDVVLGYRSKSIVAVASVVATIDNVPVAETLWGTYPDGAFHLMYFLTRPVLLDPAVPWEAVQDVLGGSPRGFRRTADQRISRIVNDFGTVAGFIQDRITDHFMGGVGSPDDSHDPLDVPEPRSDDPDKRIWQSIKERRGQPQFRQALLRLYQDKCAVTGHGPKDVLEAAHIQPHAIAGRNSTDNGLLLRADIHTLFDLRLLWIEPESLAVRIAPSLRGSPYSELDGKVLRPRVDGSRPNNTYLQERSRSG